MSSPNEEILRKMPYSELRKYAKARGIRASMKANKLISAVLNSKSECDDSFVALEQSILNSCRKNKEEKFDADKQVMSATPRRETYTIDSPMTDILALKQESVILSASPVLKEVSADETYRHVTLNRGSERKSKRKVSFVTPLRKSPRLSSVSTPKYASVKDRPKTPVASRVSFGKRKVNFADEISECSTDLEKTTGKDCGNNLRPKVKRPSTPMPKRRKTADNLEITKTLTLNSVSAVKITCAEQTLTENVKTKTPKSVVKKDPVSTSKSEDRKKLNRTVTPNFKKLHEKAFEKMESIDEYAKRKAERSSKKVKDQISLQQKLRSHQKKNFQKKESKIPKPFGGIPFIPSVKSTRRMNLNFAPSAIKQNDEKSVQKKFQSTSDSAMKKTSGSHKVAGCVSSENISMKQKNKFDLKASLAKKLPYKPHTGPLKPLTEINLNSSAQHTTLCSHKAGKPQNKVVQQKRVESRNVLRGVRKNKRFELQMKNRNI